ncbi:hypothetical protein HHK36_007764 [Tetracentron sinense]|uniref:Auxilin-related protein 2 n=1 Tax=Tetracentron sinense TaxID=13715 RepID=A0A834ZF73_TETSI|nr:hypothetical protein HHK36_007764 [Tetracentron sinense]
MDEFPGLLARDFGFRPQGKSAPMAASKSTANIGSTGNLDFGLGLGGETRSSSFASNREKSRWASASILDDHDSIFGSMGNQQNQDYDDVFGGPSKYTNPSDFAAKSASIPVFDKPVYDEDIFGGVSGMKTSSSAKYDSVKYDDVFASISSPPKHSATYDDLLGNLGRTEPELKNSSSNRSGEVEKDVPGLDDLISGFGESRAPRNRETSATSRPQQSTVPLPKSTSSVFEDPFVVLGSTSSPAYSYPLEQISKQNIPGSTKIDDSSVSRGVFDDMDLLDGLGKSVPMFSSDMNNRGKDSSSLRTGPSIKATHTSAGKEPTEKPSVKTSENHTPKKVPADNYWESHQTLFDMPVNTNSNERNSQVDMSPRSEENLDAADDVWLTVSEIPLSTQPTSAPPPSRPPPHRPAHVSKANRGSFASVNVKKNVNAFSSFPHSTHNFQSPKVVPDAVKSSDVSSIDELEDFAMGRTRDDHADVLSSEEEVETNSAAAASAAAMKEAMDRAEAKFKHAREVRERENTKSARSREAAQQEKDEKAMQDAQERELREKQERLDRERQQREKEEKEREHRRVEKERERAREIEREKEMARQAVERATKEARERAAADARLKAERAAVEKANTEARERAERAAVQRAQAEARERAAADARERAERAAAEARERANGEAREKEARERAAVARAEAEVRLRAERAAVERAAAEARERAAIGARERAAAAARENQQKNENDLESFFSTGSRPSSAPRPRATTSDPVFDTQFQNRGGPEVARRTSAGTSSSMRKASSTTNIVDDLTSIFGAAPSSGGFPDIEGESEERRRARLERHQRTQERAAKAVAEKNQRDLQTQREQAERHRIAETLDAEIKRWSAGKEANLRALLSTLQYVLWPECGWQPVSLTDLITAAAVKKSYRKATLCIHPDKVQQKGATLQQKYIAEKVFDLLKLCIGSHRLLYELPYAAFSKAIRNFLSDPRTTVVGVGIERDVKKLEKEGDVHARREASGAACFGGEVFAEKRPWWVQFREVGEDNLIFDAS